MKVCTKCDLDLNDSMFYKNIRHKTGLHSACKKCESVYVKCYQKNNKEALRVKKKNYKDKNKEKIILQSRDYYQRNKKECAIRTKKWRNENRDFFNQISKKLSIKYYKDPLKRMRTLIRNRVNKAFNYHGWIKDGRIEKLLGASYDVVKLHIEMKFEKGMNWENNGRGENCWHIDHVIPISTAKTEEELIILCHYTNLQPLWEFDNLSKNNRIIEPVQVKLAI